MTLACFTLIHSPHLMPFPFPPPHSLGRRIQRFLVLSKLYLSVDGRASLRERPSVLRLGRFRCRHHGYFSRCRRSHSPTVDPLPVAIPMSRSQHTCPQLSRGYTFGQSPRLEGLLLGESAAKCDVDYAAAVPTATFKAKCLSTRSQRPKNTPCKNNPLQDCRNMVSFRKSVLTATDIKHLTTGVGSTKRRLTVNVTVRE